MYGHYRNTGIPRLHDYAAALERFKNTKPIRGRTDITRPMYPLGHRNKVDSFWMQHCQLTQDIECMLYRTPVVTFKANGEVHIKSDGWNSISTSNFICEVLGGVSAYIYDHNLCVHLWNENGAEQYRVPNDGTLVLRREGRWQYVSGAPNNVIHRINRKAVNAARKTYADFKKYAISMIKLREGRFEREEYATIFEGDEVPNLKWSWQRELGAKWVGRVKEWMSDTSDNKYNSYYKAMLVFNRCSGYWSGSMSINEFENQFRWMTTGLHRDEVLTIETLPTGVVKKDNYGQYFRKIWDKYHEIKPEAFALGESHDAAE